MRARLPDTRITLASQPWAGQFASRFSMYIDDFVAFPGHPAFPEQAVQEALLPAFYATMRSRKFDLAVQMHGCGQISNTIVQGFGAGADAGFAMGDATGDTNDAGRNDSCPIRKAGRSRFGCSGLPNFSIRRLARHLSRIMDD